MNALYDMMSCSAMKSCLMCFMSVQISNSYESEAMTRQKLVKGHAYSVTGAEEVRPDTHTHTQAHERTHACLSKQCTPSPAIFL